eukprot:gene1555-32937_t
MESTCLPLDSLEFGFNSSTEMPPGNHNLVFCSNMEEGWTRALAKPVSQVMARTVNAWLAGGSSVVEALLQHHTSKCTTIASGTFTELAPEHCSRPAPGFHNEQAKLTGSARHATEEPQRACDEYCCKEDDIKGSWAAGVLEGNLLSHPHWMPFKADTCRLHMYAARDIARCIQRRFKTRKLLLVGDRLHHASNARYRLYHNRDSLELASSAREMLGPDWWVLSNASSGPGPEDEKLLLGISFLWSPRYVDMIRTVKLLITEFSSVANAGGASDPVVMLVGAGLWHVSRWPQEPQEKGEFNFLTNLLSHELMLNVDNKHKVAWLRHLLLLDTPTGRFTREAQQPQIQQIQDRNYGLKTWADAAFRAPYVTLLPIDRMSRSPGAPTGLLGRDWHYSCDLERFGEVFKGNSSDFLAGCLVPDETGSCQDYMNFMLWQVAANILCNGAE